MGEFMHEPQSFQQDCVELLERKLARGEIDRRRFLALLGALGATAGAGFARDARAFSTAFRAEKRPRVRPTGLSVLPGLAASGITPSHRGSFA